MWDKIANKINDHVYMSSIDRDKQRIQSTAEIFTPTDLVIEMLSKIDINRLGIGKTVSFSFVYALIILSRISKFFVVGCQPIKSLDVV